MPPLQNSIRRVCSPLALSGELTMKHHNPNFNTDNVKPRNRRFIGGIVNDVTGPEGESPFVETYLDVGSIKGVPHLLFEFELENGSFLAACPFTLFRELLEEMDREMR